MSMKKYAENADEGQTRRVRVLSEICAEKGPRRNEALDPWMQTSTKAATPDRD